MGDVNTTDAGKLTHDLFITRAFLNVVSAQAQQSPRLRKNYNFHNSDQDVCHRLLNAMEPESYIQPHRHIDINKDESLVVLRGKFGVVIFDDMGAIEGKAILDPRGDVILTNITHGVFHTLISLEKDSVFFESKAGPFTPLSSDEKAHWAPEEGDLLSKEYLANLKKLVLGIKNY
jgi:cupin fold WbuC family metalloprotein